MKAVGKQARLVFIEDGVYGQRWYSSKCGLDASEYEHLVKVIVQECAKVCLSQRDPANLNYKPSERFAEAVKQHFGVEE